MDIDLIRQMLFSPLFWLFILSVAALVIIIEAEK